MSGERQPEEITAHLRRLAGTAGLHRLREAADMIDAQKRMLANIQDQFRDHTGKLARILRGMPVS